MCYVWVSIAKPDKCFEGCVSGGGTGRPVIQVFCLRAITCICLPVCLSATENDKWCEKESERERDLLLSKNFLWNVARYSFHLLPPLEMKSYVMLELTLLFWQSVLHVCGTPTVWGNWRLCVGKFHSCTQRNPHGPPWWLKREKQT